MIIQRIIPALLLSSRLLLLSSSRCFANSNDVVSGHDRQTGMATVTTTATDNKSFPSSSSERNLAGLAQKWNVSDPNFLYGNLGFTLEYTVSDFILDDMIAHQIYDENCAEGGTTIDSDILLPQLTTETVTTSGEGDFPRQVNVTIDINSETITSSPIYSEGNGGAVAYVRFCHRFSLQTTTEPPIEVNFRETLITLTVDLTDGFEVGEITVTARDRLVQTANQVYLVEAFQCTYQNRPLSEAQLLIARSQGNIIRVCVQPDSDARADGIHMRSIDQFQWFRDYGGALGTITQLAIVDGEPAANQLTLLFCEPGQEICAFESILMAMFYRFAGTVSGTGLASMQFGSSAPSSRRRSLLRGYEEELDDSRSLQGDDDLAAAVAEIELDADVIPRPSPYKEPDSGGTFGLNTESADWWSTICYILLFVILIVAIVFCIKENPLKIDIRKIF